MDRKHQVFVSSTFKDLVEERKEVIHALLELDCIPSGMELFPATDEDAWSLIKEVIDGCDYYILILSGKYGSVNKDGVGYTEMEFDYALDTGKPIICFLHDDIENLPAKKTESSEVGKDRLAKFREKASEKHCKFWGSAPDLGGKVSRSLVQLKKKHPSDGWVPGRFAVDQKMVAEMEKMRARIAELEIESLLKQKSLPDNFDELAGGDAKYAVPNNISINEDGDVERVLIYASWDKIFSYCGPVLAGECTASELKDKIVLAYYHSIPDEFIEYNQYNQYNQYQRMGLPYVCEDQIHVQLQALGLMEPGTKKRAVSDTNTYWKLTAFGEKYLIQIKAIRKDSNKPTQPTAETAPD